MPADSSSFRHISRLESPRAQDSSESCSLVALVAAGCGVRNSKPFTAQGTAAAACKAHGFTGVTTNPAQVGFIAGFADNGGIRARPRRSGNVLTIAFTADADSTGSTEEAFRSHAPKRLRPHMSDIMADEPQRGARLDDDARRRASSTRRLAASSPS